MNRLVFHALAALAAVFFSFQQGVLFADPGPACVAGCGETKVCSVIDGDDGNCNTNWTQWAVCTICCTGPDATGGVCNSLYNTDRCNVPEPVLTVPSD